MKYYYPVLVIFRFFAVCMLAYCVYALAALLFTSYPDAVTRDEGFVQMLQMSRSQSIKGVMGLMATALLLFFVAPILARISTIGTEP